MPGLRWTREELEAYQARRRADSSPQGTISLSEDHEADPGPEHALQGKIERFCEENGLYYFHDRSRGENKPGHPDLVVALTNGRTLWLELKSQTGRLTKDQKRIRLMLMALGHEFHVVRSFKRFLEVIHRELKNG